ncbi:MAG: DUF4199 domain-containing protein [Rikenellaceae bacterium]|nr:DUF4199 domain-containing protein [Rikenellaceae bacterium]
MEQNNNFWNDAARYGAILGLLLGLSNLFETWVALSGRLSLYYLMSIEWIAVVVLHYYLLHRYTRQRSMLYPKEVGFTFGQGYGFLLTISGFAGFIVGIIQTVYLHLVLGYSNYIDRIVTAITELVANNGEVSASMEPILTQSIERLQTAPTPSIIAGVWGGIFSTLLFGAIYGLIIAGVNSRAPRPFDSENIA